VDPKHPIGRGTGISEGDIARADEATAEDTRGPGLTGLRGNLKSGGIWIKKVGDSGIIHELFHGIPYFSPCIVE